MPAREAKVGARRDATSDRAEIIAQQWGGRGDRLSERDGPIHHHDPDHSSDPDDPSDPDHPDHPDRT